MKNIGVILRAIAGVLIGATLGFLTHGMPGTRGTTPLKNTSSPGITGRSTEQGASESLRASEDNFTKLISTLRNRDELAGRVELFHLLANLPTGELPSLMERAQKLPLKFRKEMVTAILERWLELDRESAVYWIRAKGRDARCYEIWAKADPDEALKFIFGSNSSGRFSSAVTVGLETLAGKDARARVEILMRYPSSEGRNQFLLKEFEPWAATDPATAYSWALSMPEAESRDS